MYWYCNPHWLNHPWWSSDGVYDAGREHSHEHFMLLISVISLLIWIDDTLGQAIALFVGNHEGQGCTPTSVALCCFGLFRSGVCPRLQFKWRLCGKSWWKILRESRGTRWSSRYLFVRGPGRLRGRCRGDRGRGTTKCWRHASTPDGSRDDDWVLPTVDLNKYVYQEFEYQLPEHKCCAFSDLSLTWYWTWMPNWLRP